MLKAFAGLLVSAFAALFAGAAGAQTFPLPDDALTPVHAVYDDLRGIVYSTALSSDVRRVNVITGETLPPIPLFGRVSALDLSPDRKLLAVVQDFIFDGVGVDPNFSATALIHVINLDTGASAYAPFTVKGQEDAAYDVVIGSDNHAYVTTKFMGSGWTPFRRIDLATGAVEVTNFKFGPGIAPDALMGDSYIDRSEDGRYLSIQEDNNSSGPLKLIDLSQQKLVGAKDAFDPAWRDFHGYNSGVSDFNGRTGRGIMTSANFTEKFVVFDANFNLVNTVSTTFGASSLAIDPAGQFYYQPTPLAAQIERYTFPGLVRAGSMPLSAPIESETEQRTAAIQFSRDGHTMMARTKAGADILDIDPPVKPRFAATGKQVTVRIRAGATPFVAGQTGFDFGAGIGVTGVNVLSPSLADAVLTISGVAGPGLRDVRAVVSGASETLPGAFQVQAGAFDAANVVTAVLPNSRSGVPGQPITYLATALNAGPAAARKCQVAPFDTTHADFNVQRLDNDTHAVTPTVGDAFMTYLERQDYLIAMTPKDTFDQTQFSFRVKCENSDATAVIQDVNTFTASSDATQAPDILAIAATFRGDGIVHADSSSIFTAAAINIGPTATMKVKVQAWANSGVSGELCETNPTTGSCLAMSSQNSVDVTFPKGVIKTFTVHLLTPFTVTPDPANKRVRLLFVDASGKVRGSTSVAVQTDQR